jgi:hypothetical protein
MLERILPSTVAVAESFGDDPGAVLCPDELAIVVNAVESRRKEFA